MGATTLWVVAAALAQGAIALILLWVLGTIRVPLVRRGRIAMADIALSRDPWPVHEKRVANAFDNQFQLPVLFYVACGVAVYLGPNWLEVLVAWIFVLSRVVHAVVFAAWNHVESRFLSYTIGYGALVVLWIELIVHLIGTALGGH